MNSDSSHRFELQRAGIIMEPEPGNGAEAWGVLNPAGARTRDGRLLLYPRAVGEGNYSRIEIAPVGFSDGKPATIERAGFALEPNEVYEVDRRAHGGVEDPRVTYVTRYNLYVMAYVRSGGWARELRWRSPMTGGSGGAWG